MTTAADIQERASSGVVREESAQRPLLTVPELAAEVEQPEDAILEAIYSGRLPALYGTQWLVEQEAAAEWLLRGCPSEVAADASPEERVEALRRDLERRAPEGMLVYIVQRGDYGPLKIGHVRRAVNLRRRLRDIQNACAEPVKLRRLIPTERNECLEVRLHALFAEYRLEGEWFRAAPAVLKYANDWDSP